MEAMAERKEKVCLIHSGVQEGERARRSRLELIQFSALMRGTGLRSFGSRSQGNKTKGSSRARTRLDLGAGEEGKAESPGGHGREWEIYKALSIEKSKCPVEGVPKNQVQCWERSGVGKGWMCSRQAKVPRKEREVHRKMGQVWQEPTEVLRTERQSPGLRNR